MKDPASIHPLARPNALSGKIRFIHTDNTEHTYSTVVNDLSGNRLSWFDSNAPTINEKLSVVRGYFKKIRVKSLKVLSIEGDELIVGKLLTAEETPL
jgi:hypothetical protein